MTSSAGPPVRQATSTADATPTSSSAPTNFDQGKVYVYYGPSGIEASPGTATGELALDFFGNAVAGAGDVNGDGYDDIIVGKGFDHDTGKVYIYHGEPSGLNKTPVFTEVGQDATSNFGVAAGRGGRRRWRRLCRCYRRCAAQPGGRAVRRQGLRLSGQPRRAWLSLRPSSPRARMLGDQFGFSVARAGDVNGDGFDDLVVGARGYQTFTGRAYIYAGCAGGPQATPIFTATGEAANSNFGRSVSGAGDVNGDGLDDVGAGAFGIGGGLGYKAYVYHGDATVGVCAAQIELAQTLGSGGEQPACTDAITVHVKSGDAVAFCYTVTNTGSAPLNRHSLTTSVYGEVFADLPYDLAPGESYAFSATYPVTYTMDNVAVWASEWASTAPTLTAGSATTPTITASGTATATVVIVEGGLYLPLINKP